MAGIAVVLLEKSEVLDEVLEAMVWPHHLSLYLEIHA